MRPANLKGLSTVQDAIEKAIVEAEKEGLSGDVQVTALVKSGSIIGVRQVTNKTVPIPEANS
jgi:hypothetical protein